MQPTEQTAVQPTASEQTVVQPAEEPVVQPAASEQTVVQVEVQGVQDKKD